MSARKLAVQLLNRTEQEQSYSNLLLDSALSQSQLDERDKRLCASLYYGVIERRITLDAVLSHYSKQPLRKLDSTVRNILRLGIYQLLYYDQIPSRAAVNESVKPFPSGCWKSWWTLVVWIPQRHFWRTLSSRLRGLSGRIRRHAPVQNWNRHWEMPFVPQI